MSTPGKGIEKDIEQALLKSLKARLCLDGHPEVSFSTWTGDEAPADDKEAVSLPMIFIQAAPCEYFPAAKWETTVDVEIHTSHTTDNDRKAVKLAEYAASAGYCLDYDSHSLYSEKVQSLVTRRIGGSHSTEEGHNVTTLSVEIHATCLKTTT
jgi:hypothetical protein